MDTSWIDKSGAQDGQSRRHRGRSPDQQSAARLDRVRAACLRHVADNGPCIGIEQVHFDGPDALLTRADDYSLEDAVTHVLRNAKRYRLQESPITITLAAGDTGATITIHNQVPPIAPEMIGNLRVRCIGTSRSGRRWQSRAGTIRGQDVYGKNGRYDRRAQSRRGCEFCDEFAACRVIIKRRPKRKTPICTRRDLERAEADGGFSI